MVHLPKELTLTILSYFTGFNLFKVNNNLVNANIWQHRINIEYPSCGCHVNTIKNRDDYICLLATKQIKDNNVNIKFFIDLAINFNDIDLIYSLLNNFHVKANVDMLCSLGAKLIHFNKITIFNKLLDLLSTFRHSLLLGALITACSKADISLVDMLIKSGIDDSCLLLVTTAVKNLEFFIKIEQVYKKQPTESELDFAIKHEANDIAIYLIDKGLYSDKVLVFLTGQNDLTRLQKISNLIKNDYDSRYHLVSALIIANNNEHIPIIEFLLTFDVDFTITTNYIFTKYKIVNTILDNTIQQLSNSDSCENILNLVKQRILEIMGCNKDLVVITKLKLVKVDSVD